MQNVKLINYKSMNTKFNHFSIVPTNITTKRSKLVKRIICSVICLLLSTNIFAQKDVTKFLGIPVDGTKSEMRQKLIKKGFQYNAKNDYLSGEFNGRDVNIYIVTNNNKVYRIMVDDANYTDESQIKIRYNNLVKQFLNNDKYLPVSIDTIDDIDISYEMTVYKTQISASFAQLSGDFAKLYKTALNMQQNSNVTIEDSTALAELMINICEKYGYTSEKMYDLSEEEQSSLVQEVIMKELLTLMANNSVWFTINEFYGKYGITMYYDNKYNKANGEDL